MCIRDRSNCLKKDGEVILSGILNSQKDEIINLLNASNFQINDVSSKKDWVCVKAQKILWTYKYISFPNLTSFSHCIVSFFTTYTHKCLQTMLKK